MSLLRSFFQFVILPVGLALLAVGCGSDDVATESDPVADATTTSSAAASTEASTTQSTDGDTDTETLFPDVVGVEAEQSADGTWTFHVTLSSPYDSPERYADAWRVLGPDGTVYGERMLLHDHASEQPFTRSQSGIVIPDDVETVTVEGRDQVSGWGGTTMTFDL